MSAFIRIPPGVSGYELPRGRKFFESGGGRMRRRAARARGVCSICWQPAERDHDECFRRIQERNERWHKRAAEMEQGQ